MQPSIVSRGVAVVGIAVAAIFAWLTAAGHLKPAMKNIGVFLCICIGYTVAALLIRSAVAAQELGVHKFKINFEYKVF